MLCLRLMSCVKRVPFCSDVIMTITEKDLKSCANTGAVVFFTPSNPAVSYLFWEVINASPLLAHMS